MASQRQILHHPLYPPNFFPFGVDLYDFNSEGHSHFGSLPSNVFISEFPSYHFLVHDVHSWSEFQIGLLLVCEVNQRTTPIAHPYRLTSSQQFFVSRADLKTKNIYAHCSSISHQEDNKIKVKGYDLEIKFIFQGKLNRNIIN